MPKKNNGVKALAKSIDYVSIVEEMSDSAFSFCVSYLYPLYNYRVLKESDVRRIDLEENLMRIGSMIPNDYRSAGILNYYLDGLKGYFDSLLICEEHSKAESYKERFLQSLEMALGKNGTIADVEDVFLGFMILLRARRESADRDSQPAISKISFHLEKNDAEILLQLFRNKGRLEPPSKIAGKMAAIGKRQEDKSEEFNTRKFMFINNIVFLSKALPRFGAFEGER